MSKYDEICGRYDKADNEQRMTFLAALAEIERLEDRIEDLESDVKYQTERADEAEAKLEEIMGRRAYG